MASVVEDSMGSVDIDFSLLQGQLLQVSTQAEFNVTGALCDANAVTL
jgi:hypothetical protein